MPLVLSDGDAGVSTGFKGDVACVSRKSRWVCAFLYAAWQWFMGTVTLVTR